MVQSSERDDRSQRPVEWFEPIPYQFIANQGDTRLIIIRLALEQEALSGRALDCIRELLNKDGEPWGDETIILQDEEISAREASLRILEYSHVLASKECFDRRELAFCVLLRLVGAYRRPSSTEKAKELLVSLMQTGEIVRSRVKLMLTEDEYTQVFAPVDKDAFIKHTLEDLQAFVKMKLVSFSSFIITSYLSDEYNRTRIKSTSKELEMACLVAENLLSRSCFDTVLGSVEDYFAPVLDNTDHEADGNFAPMRRRLSLSLGRAAESVGDFELAQHFYDRSDNQVRSRKLKAIVAQQKPFVVQTGIFEGPVTSKYVIRGIREMKDGSVALFFGDGNRQVTEFWIVEDNTISVISMPFMNDCFHDAQVISNSEAKSDLHILVAIRDANADPYFPANVFRPAITDAIFGPSSIPNISYPLIQLWKFATETKSWHQLSTRGNIPDFRSMGIGSQTTVLNEEVILFGSASMDLQHQCNVHDNPSSVFVLNMKSKEWRLLGHPYLNSCGLGPVQKTLPLLFTTVSCQKPDGQTAVFAFRQGTALINEKRNGEEMPKYTIDSLTEMADAAEIASTPYTGNFYEWKLDIPTEDKCGYVAGSHGVQALQIGKFILVLSLSNTMDFIGTGLDKVAHNSMDGRKRDPTLDILDLGSMEWRKPNIHNSWLMDSKITSGMGIFSERSNECKLVVVEGTNRVRFLSIRNALAIQSSLENPLPKSKLKSKKNTISHLRRKATESQERPQLACANCGTFETPVVEKFKWCSRCKKPAYCSKACQALHWKQNHKEVCQKSTA